MQKKLISLDNNHLPVMVVSHERSGTHFTMNMLAACFDYVAYPWVSLDENDVNINYYKSDDLKAVVLKLGEFRTANILKSHHEFGFFSDIIAAFKDVIEIVYVYRHPADVMASFWQFLHSWHWVEGPKVGTTLEFATTPPMGHLMRYQFRQYDTMLDRWANHVEHWIYAAERSANIHAIKYEDLAHRYEAAVKGLGASLGFEPLRILRPSRDQNVVQRGPVSFVPAPDSDNRDAVAELAVSKFPNLMTSLGYTRNSYVTDCSRLRLPTSAPNPLAARVA